MAKMRTEQKSNVKNSVGRLILFGVLLLLQIIWLMFLFYRLTAYSVWVSLAITVFTFIMVLYIFGRHTNAGIKMPWIIVIMAFPMLGVPMYMLMGRHNCTRKMRKRFEAVDQKLFPLLRKRPENIELLESANPYAANLARYLQNYANAPLYHDTEVTFYPDTIEALDAQLRELRKAKYYIMMEYHAIEDAKAFHQIFEVLKERAAAGVEVRLFYDDVGSIGFIDPGFISRMEEVGIKCRVFNPIAPIFNVFMNNRDHRKITVIDSKVGFIGGYNLADEYFHITEPLGFWKDTGIMLRGSAVDSLTVTFLEMWNAVRGSDIDDVNFTQYLSEFMEKIETERIDSKSELLEVLDDDAIEHWEKVKEASHKKTTAYVQPYADSPLDEERVGENVYLMMLKMAKKYCYFTTPYLVLTDEMSREMQLAAKRGVDVRIMTPGIPDKKIIYQMTRSYYAPLCKAGVRIYEYTPGFLHAKMCIVDGEFATVGTINLDYRSLYLHFENGCVLYYAKAIREIYDDFTKIMEKSAEVTKEYQNRSNSLRIKHCLLRILAPLS
ncbi:MAG: PLDc N-terminal domain-containing protein [Lachnospiraceae bacterium]|nr:PLDc N-terminal domain-containing protein [Lachnospiraceae bacterium]